MEDNEDICFMLTAVLAKAGYEAMSATSPEDALGLLTKEYIDLFIVDTKLGEGSGLELCRSLCGVRPDIPVVIYSAAAYDSDREEGLSAGARAYVAKPGIDTAADGPLPKTSYSSQTHAIDSLAPACRECRRLS